MRRIGLLGTLGSLILVYSTFGIPLGVLVLVGFFQALPKELSEAATIDGAKRLPDLHADRCCRSRWRRS